MMNTSEIAKAMQTGNYPSLKAIQPISLRELSYLQEKNAGPSRYAFFTKLSDSFRHHLPALKGLLLPQSDDCPVYTSEQ